MLIKGIIVDAVTQAGFECDLDSLHLERTKSADHGHFSTNVAMSLSGKLGRKPHDIAQQITDHLKSEWVTQVQVAGPGFINLWLEQKFYTIEANELAADLDKYLKEAFLEARKGRMIIDYSHPNIAKPMGIHHLLTTVIGDSIKKAYRRAGWEVIADNFVGDMGTQFGKLIHAIKQWGNMDEILKDPINELQKLYVKFHIEADSDVELDDEGRAEYKKFEDGDPESRALWKKIVEWSELEIQQIYDRLGVEFNYRNGESFYEDKMMPLLGEGRRKGIIVDGQKGAWIIPPDDPEATPVLVKKSDGATLYTTRDLARIDYWERTWSPDLMVNVVDVSQSFHFEQLFFAQQKLGLTSARNVHVVFGRMLFKDGKMSTRKGNILLLSDVLDEAEERALVLIREKEAELSEAEAKELARILGIGSIKYNILHQNRTTNITFDWDKMLSFEGNSAPYLMYSVARAKSVLRKANMKIEDTRKYALSLDLPVEQALLLQLIMYPSVISRCVEDFKPNHIANYLYELAQLFNSFYNGNSILQAESSTIKESRLLLTACTIAVMEDAFKLLGLEVPEKM